jgi:4-hydroxy-tetrahydrodipicolinate synthase
MNTPLFTGVCTAMVTPYLDGKVNFPMAEQLLKRQLAAGISAVVLAGTTGEAPTLSDEEKLELFRRCKRYVGDDCIIIAGTGSNDTAHAIRLSAAAENAGADALLVVTPYYNKSTPDGLIAHYLAISQAVTLPIILYNVPTRTCVDIPVEVCQQLAKLPNIVGIKEASADITRVTRIKNACGPNFSVWSGNDDLTVPTIALGGQGVISVTSNIVPGEMVAMANAALASDLDTAAHLQQKLQPLQDLLFCEVNPIPVKAALKRLGYDCGGCRLPLLPLSAKNQRKLDAFFSMHA